MSISTSGGGPVIYATSGWQRGLVVGAETWSASELKRSTATSWTQDDTGLSYQLNPRVTVSSVSDSANSRRTEIEYLTAQESEFRLPKKVSEFRGGDATPLRYTESTYELGHDYTELRHIVGLVAEQRLFDGAGSLQSKTGYAYDTAGCVTNQPGAVRHDDGYDAATKRGALCSVTRYRAGAAEPGVDSRRADDLRLPGLSALDDRRGRSQDLGGLRGQLRGHCQPQHVRLPYFGDRRGSERAPGRAAGERDRHLRLRLKDARLQTSNGNVSRGNAVAKEVGHLACAMPDTSAQSELMPSITHRAPPPATPIRRLLPAEAGTSGLGVTSPSESPAPSAGNGSEPATLTPCGSSRFEPAQMDSRG